MAYSENKRRYNIEYAKQNIKRVPLDMQLSKYEKLKEAAAAAGESVNGYIKTAVDMRMKRDKSNRSDENLT